SAKQNHQALLSARRQIRHTAFAQSHSDAVQLVGVGRSVGWIDGWISTGLRREQTAKRSGQRVSGWSGQSAHNGTNGDQEADGNGAGHAEHSLDHHLMESFGDVVGGVSWLPGVWLLFSLSLRLP